MHIIRSNLYCRSLLPFTSSVIFGERYPDALVKHWHGGTSDTAMTHLAMAESLNGSPVEWLEKVSDEQYRQ